MNLLLFLFFEKVFCENNKIGGEIERGCTNNDGLAFFFLFLLFVLCVSFEELKNFCFFCFDASLLLFWEREREREIVTVYGVSVEERRDEIASMIFFNLNFYPLKKTTSLSYFGIYYFLYLVFLFSFFSVSNFSSFWWGLSFK